MKFSTLLLCTFVLVPLNCSAFADDAPSAVVERVESGLASADQADRGRAGLSLADRMKHYDVPGVSIAVIDDGEIAWAKGYGVREKGTETPVGTDTLFQAASISKPVTAAATLQLAEEGKLDLDTNVNSYLKSWQVPDNEFTADQPVTLRGILTHTAGTSVSGFMGYRPDRPLPTTVQILDGVKPANSKPVRVVRKPGTKWSYSGGGTTIQQLILEDVTGIDFQALLSQRVLQPLKMNDSTFEQPLPEHLRDRAARSHQSKKVHSRKWNVYPELAAAGLWTTPTDLARFAIAVREAYRGESDILLSQETARQMLTPSEVSRESGLAYGLGPAVAGQAETLGFGHGGGNVGFRCLMVLMIESGDGAVVMNNGGNGEILNEEIFHSIAAAYQWPGERYRIEPKDDDKKIVPNENLELTGLPPIPQRIADAASRYSHTRQAGFASWHPTRQEMLINTRFADTSQVHHLKMPGGARNQLTFFKEPVRAASFEPNRGEYFCFARDTGGGEFYQNFRFDIGNGDVTLLTDGVKRNSSGEWSHSGQAMAYSRVDANDQGAFTQIRVVPPTKPEQDRLVAQVPGGGWGVLDWSPDDKKLLMLEYISINESYLWIINVESGERRRLTNPPEGTKVAYGGGQWTSDGKGIYTATDIGGEFRQLNLIDVESMTYTNLTESISWDVSGFDRSPDGEAIVLATNEAGISRVYLLGTESRQLKPIEIPIGIVSSLKWHPSINEIAMTFSSATSPADVYSYLPESDELVQWTDSEIGPIDAGEMQQPQLINWKSFDDREISGFLYSPPRRFTGKRPVIVRIHGGPESQSRPGFLGRMNYFINELGIAVILPNVRGSRGYGKSFLKLDNGLLREGTYRDIEALLRWIGTQEDLDADRILVTGGSYGGHMTLASAARHNDLIRCSIDVVGISNLRTFLENTQGYRRDLRRAEYGDERDPEIRSFLDRTAPLTMSDQIRKPMLVVQGRNDPRVPVTESDQIVETLQKSETPVWYVVANDEGHGFRKKRNADFQFYATTLFIEQFLLD
jgi:dipeptidyl aminopeptidase/acylaminoacyl peptidase/CubicO group peptidase (beta-lactamase class C family)